VSNDKNSSQNELLFVQVVSMFQVAALQHMGKLPNPVTNTIERDLDQARISVDILGMLKEKTEGNLSDNEKEFLGKVVFESQMNFLEELKKPEEPKASAEEAAETDAGGRAEPSDGEESESLQDEPVGDEGDVGKQGE
jgi:hypothetical protein